MLHFPYFQKRDILKASKGVIMESSANITGHMTKIVLKE